MIVNFFTHTFVRLYQKDVTNQKHYKMIFLEIDLNWIRLFLLGIWYHKLHFSSKLNIDSKVKYIFIHTSNGWK